MPKNPAPAPADNPPLPAPRASQLVDALWELNRQRNHLDGEIAQLEAALIATGAGKHSGDDPDHVLTVVAAGEPGVKYVHLDEDGGKKAREICGDAFSDLFERDVAYKPRTGFLDRVDTALAAAAKRNLLALVEQPTAVRKAYILGLPKPAKK
jgi:hypothetical protein